MIERIAREALNALAWGKREDYRRWLLPTVSLSYWVFQPPTAAYKHGIATAAMFSGKQDNDLLLPHNPHRRSFLHQVGIFRLMDMAGLFTAEQASEVYQKYLAPRLWG